MRQLPLVFVLLTGVLASERTVVERAIAALPPPKQPNALRLLLQPPPIPLLTPLAKMLPRDLAAAP
jgi:hypothetical protein